MQKLQPQVMPQPDLASGMVRARKSTLNRTPYFWVYLFVLPFFLLYAGFTLYPLAATAYYSFFDWNGIGPLDNFIGLENYQSIINDPVFWGSFRNTLLFATLNTAIKLPLSLFVAIWLTRRWLWMKRLWRTVFFSPMVIPVALAGLVFTMLLNPANGAFNDFLMDSGLREKPVLFLAKNPLPMLSLVLISVWQIFGQYMVYWMAALTNVPDELYEAAELDGAGEWGKLIHITLPIIRPVAVIIFFLAFVNALKVFGLIVTLTGGGPGDDTYVVSYFIYTRAFTEFPFRYGYASAAALLFGVLVLTAVTMQGLALNYAQNRRREYGV